MHVHMIFEVLTLVEVGAAKLIVDVVDLVGLGDGLASLGVKVHSVHEDALFLVHSTDPLEVHLHWVEINCTRLSATTFDHA